MRKYLRYLTPIIIRVLLSLERGLKTTTAFTTSNEFKRKTIQRSDKLTMMQDVFPSFDNMVSHDQATNNVYFFDEIDSTMNKASTIMPENKDKSVFSVVAKKQTSGRATKNRTWISADRNLYMTVVLDRASLGSFPLILLPLKVGVLIAPLIQLRVYSGTPVHLKWPNDVLIGDQKICGTLIEVKDDRILIGIGCNIMTAPRIDSMGADAGRAATCLADHAPKQQITSIQSRNDDDDELQSLSLEQYGYSTQQSLIHHNNTANTQIHNTINNDNNNNTHMISKPAQKQANTNNHPKVEENDTISTSNNQQQQQQQEQQQLLLYEVCDKLCDDLAIEITSTFEAWINSTSSTTSSSSSGNNYNYFSGGSREWGGSSGTSGSSGNMGEETIKEFEKWMDKSPQILRKEYSNTIPYDYSSHQSSSSSSSSYSNRPLTGDNDDDDDDDDDDKYDSNNNRNVNSLNADANNNNNNNNNSLKSQSLKGEKVQPLKINNDGTLQVKVLSTGMIRTLIADYLW